MTEEAREPVFRVEISEDGRSDMPLLSQTLERLTLQAQLNDGEVIRYNYLPTSYPEDVEEGPRPRVYARLVVELLEGPQ
jgi:hypothetical protein